MKKIFKHTVCFVLIFPICRSFSQQTNGNFYAFNADWSAAKSIDVCTYFMQEIKNNDTEYVCRYYNKSGPMIRQESYKDEALSIPNGRFCWYNEKGKIDSCGLVKNFKKDGRWDYFSGDSTQPTYYAEYDNGKLVKQGTYNNTANNTKDTLKEEKDSLRAAEFKSGQKAWTKYLSNNLKTPGRLMSTLGRGAYMATVCFLINKEGNVEDLYLRKSVEWSADAEIFNIIKSCPRWEPATRNGKPIFYRQVQNISYNID